MIKKILSTLMITFILIASSTINPVTAAYKAHNSDSDTEMFIRAYPTAKDTKLDNCYLCHTGGNMGKKYLDACDYCHATYGFKPPHGDITKTFNSFGAAYYESGRSLKGLQEISTLDSDGDSFTNAEEILAGKLPGDANDNPDVAEAPAKVYTRTTIHTLPKTEQPMAVDTAKAGDFYAAYAGVDMWTLLQDAKITDQATDITVFAADGYSRNFTIDEIKQDYLQSKFFTMFPWLNFPSYWTLPNGEQLPGKLRFLLAYERDGAPLLQSKIVADAAGKSSMDGEGTYRFITPLTEPIVPDRSQYSIDREDAPYPFNPNRPVIRNGDYCIKAVVAIRVNTADNKSAQYDWSGKSWQMVEKGELVVYGALQE